MSLNHLNTLFLKILCIFLFAVTLLLSVLEITSFRQESQNAFEEMVREADTVTELIAMQIGGSVKFGNSAAVATILAEAREYAGESWVRALTIDSEQKQIFPEVNQDAPADIDPAMRALGQRVLETGEIEFSDDRRSTGHPIRFGSGSQVVGAIVTTWTEEPRLAAKIAIVLHELTVTAVMCLGVMIVVGFAVRQWISKPLKNLEIAVSEVGVGNYDVNIPAIGRGDEIGQIARELENFRFKLKEGAQTAFDSAYKGSAFEGSSAPMMVINNGFEVIYCNPACYSLLRRLEPDLIADWDGFNLNSVVGANVRSMTTIRDVVQDIEKRSEEAFPVSVLVPVGNRRIQIKFNAATDNEGKMNGAVIEWSERTAAQHNQTLIAGIDTAMLRAEISSNGVLSSANENFLTMLGLDNGACGRVRFNDLFDRQNTEMENPLTDGTVVGRFCFKGQGGVANSITDGSSVALKGLDGKVEKNLFVGMDVTEAEIRQREAQVAKEKSDAEQESVVAALGAALTSLASGRLDAEISTPFTESYENLRRDYNGAIQALREALSLVVNNTSSIRNETGEITSAADDLARRTERQAATLEETAAALDEVTNSVRSAAEGAQGASEKASAAQLRAQEGGDVAREAVSAMSCIQSSSAEISKITSVIDDIAFQTNLLALNAGVEAARAGEAGRGFAVVATEVRALAQRSSDAAREINELISASENQVRSGVELVDKTGTALAAIVDSISEISGLVSNIAVSTKEQASGLNEVNSAVIELDQVTQQNAAMFEETTAASHALTAEADALASAMSRFELGSETAAVAPRQSQAPVPAGDRSRVSAASSGSASAAVAAENDALDWEDF